MAAMSTTTTTTTTTTLNTSFTNGFKLDSSKFQSFSSSSSSHFLGFNPMKCTQNVEFHAKNKRLVVSATTISSNLSVDHVPLPSKTRRHTISVFVGDESGMINRIAGVFARRGFNIESLAVGLNKDKALFTIVVCGTDKVLRQVMEQLQKLVNVLKVEDISKEPQVERELMLVKVRADEINRAEIMWLVDIFRAKIVDTSEEFLTLELTGVLSKMVALQRLLEPYGICEVARTGRVALVRESGVDSKYLRGYSFPV